MKAATTSFEDWKALQSFQDVVSEYQNRYFSSFSLKARDYEALHMSTHTEVRPSCLIAPSPADLAADIASAIRSGVEAGTITERQANYYRRYYESGRVAVLTQTEVKEAGCDEELEDHIEHFGADLQESVRKIDRKVRLVVGRTLIAKGVSPIKQYLHAIDTRELKGERLRTKRNLEKRTAEFRTLRVTAKKAVAA